MKIGLAQWELNQLVADLKAGKSWDEIARTRLTGVDAKVLEASDYKAYAHREAGLPEPDATAASTEPAAPATEEPVADADDDLDEEPEAGVAPEPQRGGRRRR